MKQVDLATDAETLAGVKPGDVVLVRARVVEVYSDDMTVDIFGHGSRYRLHPRKSLVAAVEPHAEGTVDIVEQLVGPMGRADLSAPTRRSVTPIQAS